MLKLNLVNLRPIRLEQMYFLCPNDEFAVLLDCVSLFTGKIWRANTISEVLVRSYCERCIYVWNDSWFTIDLSICTE